MNREELLKIAKPILFNTEMVQAILEGRKSVTRRVVSEKIIDKYYEYDDFCISVETGDIPTYREYEEEYFMKKARYKVGDILYIRETWCQDDLTPDDYYYRANYTDKEARELFNDIGLKWKPSIHMPKSIARIFLNVTDIRVEKLQDITEIQVVKEGFSSNFDMETDTFYPDGYYFVELWNSTVKKQDLDRYGWDANPWVFVIEFERVGI
jgi:hypothetical protein